MIGKQDWETPWEIFNKLDNRFQFTLDGAARADNSKCELFFTPEMDAHKQSPEGHNIFCNPPYADINPWVTTFLRWAKDNTVVALLQDKTDTGWWRRLTKEAADEVVILHGRVNFIGTETGNMHGAVVLAFGLGHERQKIDLSWDWRNEPYPL